MMASKKLDLVITNRNGNSFYNRSQHFYAQKVCSSLSSIYGDKKVVLLPSGMASIATVFHVINMDANWSKFNIVYGNELYCDTPRTINYMNQHYTQCNLHKIDVANDDEVNSVFRNKINKNLPTVLYIESCSNPSGYVFNFDLINEIRANVKKLTVVVDNTWLSGAVFNPFDFDIDFVVTSLTKYYSAGACIGGALIGKSENKLMDYASEWVRVMGFHVSPFNCRLIFDNIKNLSDRINKSYDLTLRITKFLKENNVNVTFVGLDNHKSNKYISKYFNNLGPSVFTIKMNMSKSQVDKMLKKCEYFPYETSFGSKHSKFDPWPQKISENETMIRFSVGYEDTFENMVSKFSKMFNIN